MDDLPPDEDDSRWRFRLAVIGVVILAIALIVAIIYGSVRVALGPVMARYYYYPRGHSSAMKGELDRAIADFSEAIRLDPNYHDARFARGYVRNQNKQVDQAIADYSETIRLNPKYTAAYMNRGGLYFARNELDRAIADYTEVILLNPRDSEAWYARGNSFSMKEELDKAIADCDHAIQLNPGRAPAFCTRGYAWRKKHQLDKAIADYSEAIRLAPDDAGAYTHRGNAYIENEEYEKAIADLSQAIRLDPGDAYARNSIAWIWTFCSDPAFCDTERALESATKACELSGWKVPAFIETLAGACAESGDFEAAAKWQTKANALLDNPEDRTSGEERLAYYQGSQ
jgi:tetratricopeptide (TPR) repeat protein